MISVFMYRKPDDKRDPIVLIASKFKKAADKKLIEVVDGLGYIGEWQRKKLTEEEQEFYLNRLQFNTLYEKQEEKQNA